MTNDDTLRTALTNLADGLDPDDMVFTDWVIDKLRALLAAHPAPETSGPCLPSLGETCGDCHRCAPVTDTRREDVARALALVDSLVDPPMSGRYGRYADAVLAVLPAPPVVDEVEIRDLILQVDEEGGWQNIYRAEANTIASAIAARIARGATR